MPSIRFLFVLMLFSACQLNYEDNRRLLISGRVVGFENEELPVFPIEAYASGSFPTILFIPYTDIDVIGTTLAMEDMILLQFLQQTSRI